MKKIIVTLLIIFSTVNTVNANEYYDITDEVEIRYKWYKEIITGEYYPLKDISEDDKVDANNIKHGLYSYWDREYCNLSNKFYEIEKKTNIKYKKVKDARYVLLENIQYADNIKIYYNNKLINFEIISNEQNIIKIDLKMNYMCETLTFIIENSSDYKISLYNDAKFSDYIISKEIQNEQILIPDKTWITDKTYFINYIINIQYNNSDLTTEIDRYDTCRYREKYVYKYEVQKSYYDDNYHLNIEGYIKDVNDYRFFYKGSSLVNSIEITKEKIVKQPQIEYIYIENENNDSSPDCEYMSTVKTEVKTKTIEKEVFKIPKTIYIVFLLLTFTIIILIIKLHKKYVG